MLASGLIISGLTLRLRRQAEWARQRGMATAALYAMSRTLLQTRDLEDMVPEAARQLSSVFDAKVAVLLPDEAGNLKAADLGDIAYTLDERESAVADWTFRHGESAGLGTSTLPLAAAHYHPLSASGGPAGVMGLKPSEPSALLDPERLHLLETFTNQVGLALERARLVSRARAVETEIDMERLRNSLLSAVSHDLRTPLASIMGSSSTLIEKADLLPPETRRELEDEIYDEAEHLNRLVGNLLDVTRLEAGALALQREWSSIEEIVGVVLARLSRSLARHPVTTSIPSDLPLLPMDPVLIEQALFNIVDNAVRHTPPGTPIVVSAEERPGDVVISVADAGPGIAPGDEEQIFEKFHRAKQGKPGGGVGLGLTISKGIVAAHGGRVWVESRAGAGAVFRFSLPRVGNPPSIPEEGALAPSSAAPVEEPGPGK
jgi:two-component system sensor histidine kinase KdpD